MSQPSIRRVVHASGALLALVVAIQLFAGCSDDDNPSSPGGGTPQGTSFVGIFTNGSENGKITINVSTTNLAGRIRPSTARSATAYAVGMLSFAGGGTASLLGTYNDVTDSLNLSGGGYTFIGEYEETNTPPAILGGYTGPGGAGGFGAIPSTVSTSPIEVYLGTFQSDSTNLQGTFNVARWDTIAGGFGFVEGKTEAFGMEGTVTGSGITRSITLAGGDGLSVTATGTLNTATKTTSGIWHSYDAGLLKGDDGTWAGALQP